MTVDGQTECFIQIQGLNIAIAEKMSGVGHNQQVRLFQIAGCRQETGIGFAAQVESSMAHRMMTGFYTCTA